MFNRKYDNLVLEINNLKIKNRQLTEILTKLLERLELIVVEKSHHGRKGGRYNVIHLFNKQELKQDADLLLKDRLDDIEKQRINLLGE